MPQPKTCLAKPKFSGANWDKVIPHIHTYIHIDNTVVKEEQYITILY